MEERRHIQYSCVHRCESAVSWIVAGAVLLDKPGRSIKSACLLFKVAPITLSRYIAALPEDMRATIRKEGRRHAVTGRASVVAVYWMLQGAPDQVRTYEAAAEHHGVSLNAIRNALPQSRILPSMLPNPCTRWARDLMHAQIAGAIDQATAHPRMRVREIAYKWGIASRVLASYGGDALLERYEAEKAEREEDAIWRAECAAVRRSNRLAKVHRRVHGPRPGNAPMKLPKRPE